MTEEAATIKTEREMTTLGVMPQFREQRLM
jgi:hypothetical protein